MKLKRIPCLEIKHRVIVVKMSQLLRCSYVNRNELISINLKINNSY